MAPASRPVAFVLAVGFTLALAAFVGFAAVVDVFAPSSETAIFWPKLAVMGFGSIPAAAIALVVRKRWMLAALGVTAAVVAAMLLTAWHPRKAFVRDLESLRPGATVDDVERVMGRYEKGVGAKWGEAAAPDYPEGAERAHATGTMYYRWNSTDGAYDSDWGRVDFEDGRVTKTEFLPD
jgi:hypothetical protein